MFDYRDADAIGQDSVKEVEREGRQIESADISIQNMASLGVTQHGIEGRRQFSKELVSEFI